MPLLPLLACLIPRKALALLAFHYPVNAYFRAVKEEENPIPPQPNARWLVVFRHEDTVWRMDLDPTEFMLLQRLFSGMTIGDALDSITTASSDTDDAVGVMLTEWFARWMRNGLLAAFDTRSMPPSAPS